MTEQELEEALKKLKGWVKTQSTIPGSDPQESRVEIRKTFNFGDFDSAWRFMENVAHTARVMDHHPRWENQYGGVSIWLSTWAAGACITKWDVNMADEIDRIYRMQMRSA